MFEFEQFERINRSHWSEDEMRRNYEIALKVEERYYATYGTAMEPKIGDIVEYTDGWRVYSNAKIVENLYCDGTDKVCVCDSGHSFTNGDYFSTSGGSFHSKEKALMQYVGEAENYVWSWGCYGSGADQGINIPIKVNRWIIPYDPKAVKRSTVRFKQCNPEVSESVWIENSDECWIHAKTFKSKRAFEAWAKYVGYEYHMEGEVAYSPQKIVNRCWTENVPKPENSKPIKVLANGRVHDGIAVTEDTQITEWWPNLPESYPPYGTVEDQEQMKAYWRYNENPMGV